MEVLRCGLLAALLTSVEVFCMNVNLYGPCTGSHGQTCRTGRTGNIIFGGFFPIHEVNSTTSNCSTTVRPGSGLQRLEAARWALQKLPPAINRGGTLTFGYDFRDSCSSETVMRDQALDFINVGQSCRFSNRPISMVLGASSSDLANDLTNLLTLFKIPHISYAATADFLGNADNTQFYRTVPPDSFQVEAMISLMEHFNWTYVSLVYSNDLYGTAASEQFTARQSGTGNGTFRYCIAASVQMAATASAAVLNSTLNQLTLDRSDVWHRNASVVILFMSAQEAKPLLEAAAALNGSGFQRMTFVVSDALSGDIFSLRDLGSSAIGILSVEPAFPDNKLVADFLTDFEARTRSLFPLAVWYTDYFQALFPNCSDFTQMPCSAYTPKDSPLYSPDGKVAAVIEAVDLAIRVVYSTLSKACSSIALCPGAQSAAFTSVNADLLSNHFPMTSLTVGNSTIVFNSTSRSFLDVANPTRYVIKNVVPANATVTRKIEFADIGTWSSGTGLRMRAAPVLGNGQSTQRSICAEQCRPGYFRNRIATDSACCWSCVRCADHNHAPNNTVNSCTPCPASMTANGERTACVPLAQSYIAFSNAVGGFTMALAALGLISTVVVIVVFLKHSATPLVVASSRELSSCLLVGFVLSYLLTIPFFLPPTAASCGLRRFGLGFTLSLCLSALLVKTNRISRIFNRRMGAGRPKYTTPAWQLVFTACLVSVEVIILIAWLSWQLPSPSLQVQTANTELLLVCEHSSSIGLSSSLAYNIILLLICTYYGVKTRKIPENFNEAKYINFSTYTICAVSFAFIPAYATVRNDVKPTMLILPHVLNITCMLAFLFVPKAYIIVFHPEQNVRSTARRKSKDYGRKQQRAHMSRRMQSTSSLATPGADSPAASPMPQRRKQPESPYIGDRDQQTLFTPDCKRSEFLEDLSPAKTF